MVPCDRIHPALPHTLTLVEGVHLRIQLLEPQQLIPLKHIKIKKLQKKVQTNDSHTADYLAIHDTAIYVLTLSYSYSIRPTPRLHLRAAVIEL